MDLVFDVIVHCIILYHLQIHLDSLVLSAATPRMCSSALAGFFAHRKAVEGYFVATAQEFLADAVTHLEFSLSAAFL